MIPTLRLGQLNRPGQAVSVYRTFYPPRHRYPLHRHDFAELFFIESGTGAQLVDGTTRVLATGDLGFVDPEAAHALNAADDAAMVLVNIAFSRRLLNDLRRVVAPRDWPWLPGQAAVCALDEPEQAFVVEWIDRLDHADAGITDIAAFVVDLLRRLKPTAPAARRPPEWLSAAVAALDRPQVLARGVDALARGAGRCGATVGRAVRAHYGCTAIQLVNRRRMAWLAGQLRLSRRSIPDLADAVGLPSLSNCYRLFRAAYGCSPALYRRRFQGGVRSD